MTATLEADAIVVVGGIRRTKLWIVENAIESKLTMREQLVGEVERQRAAEQAAIETYAENPEGASPYNPVGGGAYSAQQKRVKAETTIRNIDAEVEALGRRKERLVGDQAADNLKEAIKNVRPLHTEMAAAITEAAEVVAGLLRETWPKYQAALNELVAATQRGEGIAGEAVATVPDALAQWRQAVSSPLEPVPANFGWFLDAILLAAFDPSGDITAGGNQNRLARLVPDLRGEDVHATPGKMKPFRVGSPIGHVLETQLRNAPHVQQEAERSPEDQARDAEIAAARDAEMQERFELARPFHEAAAARLAEGYAATAHQRPVVVAPPPSTQNRETRGELDEPITEAELAAIARFDAEDGD